MSIKEQIPRKKILPVILLLTMITNIISPFGVIKSEVNAAEANPVVDYVFKIEREDIQTNATLGKYFNVNFYFANVNLIGYDI